MSLENQETSAKITAERCQILEEQGIEINTNTVVWQWGAHPFQQPEKESRKQTKLQAA